jgi:hypothetical protein
LAGHHKLKRYYLPSNRFARPAAMKFGGFLFKLIYMNILQKANEIVNLRSEEKERMYGDFIESMQKASKLSSIMSNKEINVNDCYNVLIALKLARQSHSHKEDNLLDAVAYIGSLNEYLNNLK